MSLLTWIAVASLRQLQCVEPSFGFLRVAARIFARNSALHLIEIGNAVEYGPQHRPWVDFLEFPRYWFRCSAAEEATDHAAGTRTARLILKSGDACLRAPASEAKGFPIVGIGASAYGPTILHRTHVAKLIVGGRDRDRRIRKRFGLLLGSEVAGDHLALYRGVAFECDCAVLASFEGAG